MAAQAPPGPETTAEFCTLLKDELEPWAKRFNTPVSVRMLIDRPTSPWLGLLLHTGSDAPDARVQQDWESLLTVPDAPAARKSVVSGKSVSGRVDTGGPLTIKK